MLEVIKKLLLKIIANIDSGNSNLAENEMMQVIETLRSFTDKEVRLSKYQACQYVRLGRASFDNYVRMGQIPKGLKQQGFKELFWMKKDLDKFLKSHK